MKTILLAMALALLLSSTANADCQAQFSNGPGDTLTGWWHLDTGGNAVSASTWSSGGEPLDFNPDSETRSNNNFDFEFTIAPAQGYNDVITSNISAGSCYFHDFSVIPMPQPSVQLVALSQEGKDTAQWWSDGFQRTYVFAQGLNAVAVVLCATGEVEFCLWAKVMSSMATVAKTGKSIADFYVNDPWDGDFTERYNPAWQSVDHECDGNGLCEWTNTQAEYMLTGLDGASGSLNRASSAAQSGDSGSFYDRQAEMNYYFWYAGNYGAKSYADGLWALADYLEQAQITDADQVQQLRDAAWFYSQMGDSLMSQCGWCQ
jgi:hypothetical protein